MNLCVIPARSGSLRLKNKNIKIFKKKPLIYFSIKAAKKSKIFDKIIVSTNSPLIKKIAIKYGAEVPFLRSQKLSNHKAKIVDVINHAINFFEKKKINFENTCCIYPTAIFLEKELIRLSYKKFARDKKSYLVSTSEFPSFIEKGFKINKGGVKLLEQKYKNKNSNNLSPTYYDAGQFLWGKSAAFKSKKEIFSKHTSTYLLNSPKYIDLNTNDDWKKILLYSKIFK